MLKNNLIRTEKFFLDFNPYKKYNPKKIKIFKKVAVDMERGRPKLEIPRQSDLHLRLSKFEFEKIARVAKEKNLTRTAAILQGIDLLEKNKPQRMANIKELLKKRGKHFDDDDDD